MYGVSKIASQQNIMLITFPGAEYSAANLAEHLNVFAREGVVLDMICQSIPHGASVDYSFTANYSDFATVMKSLPALTGGRAQSVPLISGGYSKLNLFGEEMVNSVGVAARAMSALSEAGVDISLITTSDLDISLLIHENDEDTALEALHKAFNL